MEQDEDQILQKAAKSIVKVWQLLKVKDAANWLNEVQDLLEEYHPGILMDEELIYQEWLDFGYYDTDEENKAAAWESIKAQRAAQELLYTKDQAWKNLRIALQNYEKEEMGSVNRRRYKNDICIAKK